MLTRDDFAAMPPDQLERVRDLVVSVIAEKEAAKLEAFRKEIENRAKKAGISLESLLKSNKVGGKVAPKYRNPANASETWSGRGIAPRWFSALNKAAQEAALIKRPPATAPVGTTAPATAKTA